MCFMLFTTNTWFTYDVSGAVVTPLAHHPIVTAVAVVVATETTHTLLVRARQVDKHFLRHPVYLDTIAP